MAYKTLFRGLAMACWAAALWWPASAGDKKPPGGAVGILPTGEIVQIDTGNPPRAKPWTRVVERGDLVQMHVVHSAAVDEMKVAELKGLRVEIEGDAAQCVGVFTMPVRTGPLLGGNAGRDATKADLVCVVRAEKAGNATVSITPVGSDGKDRPARQIVLSVRDLGAQKSKKTKG